MWELKCVYDIDANKKNKNKIYSESNKKIKRFPTDVNGEN